MVRARYVAPEKGARGALRFSFRDVVMLRAARDLLAADVSPRRLGAALRALQAQLPSAAPASGLSISAIGDRVVVQEAGVMREPRSGQLLLRFEVRMEEGRMRVVDLPPASPSRTEEDDGGECEAAFQAALALEDADPEAAVEAYRQCIARHGHPAAHANLGRLLHLRGSAAEAVTLYRSVEDPDAIVLFNLGVALEDLGKRAEAIPAYERALALDETLADAHHNLGQLLLAAGERQRALRHLSRYRQLAKSAD
jgi:tetratricopeptide (TPR) repeat protein